MIVACEHGERTGRAGVSRATGKPWAGWFCPQRLCEPFWATEELVAEVEYLRRWRTAKLAPFLARPASGYASERVQRLLELAVSTDSDAEAATALARAREAHREAMAAA